MPPDICTLIVVTTQTLLACIPQSVCNSEPIDGKIFCRPGAYIECNRPPPPSYQCKRMDGTNYIFTEEQKQ